MTDHRSVRKTATPYPETAQASAQRGSPLLSLDNTWDGTIVLPGGAVIWRCSHRRLTHRHWRTALDCAENRLRLGEPTS